MEPPSIPALDNAADDYADKRDARMRLTQEEVEAREEVERLMQEHGLRTYRTRDGLEVELDTLTKAKVKRSKESDAEE
jgi:hypothetical protein